MPTEVILDVDTGVDDALAILFALRHPGLNVRAITCVAGNVDLEQVVANTLTVLDVADAVAVPVGRGAARPLLGPPADARGVHGRDGLGGLREPRGASTRAIDGHAVGVLREQILDAPRPVTLVPLGPLTNIALLLRTHSEVVDNLDRIVFMGGGTGTGNASPVAEFNVWHDPEAAAIVLDAGVPTTMYGLDVFYAVAVGSETYTRLQTDEDPALRLAGGLVEHSHGVVRADPRAAPGGLIGDAGAVCAVADPSRLVTECLPVTVELGSGPARGQTVVDRRMMAGEAETHGVSQCRAEHVAVAVGTDPDHYRDLFLATLLGEEGR